MRSPAAMEETGKAVCVSLRMNAVTNSMALPFSRYSEKKIAENNEAEILSVVEEEARNGYAEEAIVVLPSEKADQLESHTERVVAWIHEWRRQRGFGA